MKVHIFIAVCLWQQTLAGIPTNQPVIDRSVFNENYIKSVKDKSDFIVLDGFNPVGFTDVDKPLTTIDLINKPPPVNNPDIEVGVGVPPFFIRKRPSSKLRRLTDEKSGSEFSVVHPIFVRPPDDFKPIIYPTRRIDGSEVDNDVDKVTIKPPVSPYPYKYPYGLSSWILGGIRAVERGSFWEQLASDESLNGNKFLHKNLPFDVNYSRTKDSLNTLKPFDFHNLLIDANDQIKPPAILVENIEFIPVKMLNSLDKKTPNYEFKSTQFKDLMTSDGRNGQESRYKRNRNSKILRLFDANLV